MANNILDKLNKLSFAQDADVLRLSMFVLSNIAGERVFSTDLLQHEVSGRVIAMAESQDFNLRSECLYVLVNIIHGAGEQLFDKILHKCHGEVIPRLVQGL